jgi:hypothetical protein
VDRFFGLGSLNEGNEIADQFRLRRILTSDHAPE